MRVRCMLMVSITAWEGGTVLIVFLGILQKNRLGWRRGSSRWTWGVYVPIMLVERAGNGSGGKNQERG